MGNKQVETKLNPAQRACTGEPNQQTKQEDHQTELLCKYFNRPKMDDKEDSTDNDAAAVAVAVATDATDAAAVAGAADATDTAADAVPMAADATNVNAVAMAAGDVGDDLVDTDDDGDKDESAEVSRPQTIWMKRKSLLETNGRAQTVSLAGATEIDMANPMDTTKEHYEYHLGNAGCLFLEKLNPYEQNLWERYARGESEHPS